MSVIFLIYCTYNIWLDNPKYHWLFFILLLLRNLVYLILLCLAEFFIVEYVITSPILFNNNCNIIFNINLK